jgi:hypothetical protein
MHDKDVTIRCLNVTHIKVTNKEEKEQDEGDIK